MPSGRLRGALGAGAAALAGGVYWWRTHPSACPYGQRFLIQIPHPPITRRRLLAILQPARGERILEIGPGTGHYTLDVAAAVGPDGRLDIFDLQQEMLDHTVRRATERGLENIEPAKGDATALPYEDDLFDAAFLVTVLGEIPDQDAALRELQRVVKPGGRVVVGEVIFDPHMVTLGQLEARGAAAGLSFDRHSGSKLGYFARLTA
ncbi:MAG: hypothetical protein QOG09_1753 [Solirubrobacterales bacterium]|nr:hypothetical protein [Solirubrobacterales bacterium]